MIEKGYFKTHLKIDKSATMMLLDFDIEGHVELICDRSLDIFEEPIAIQERLILKFGDHDEQLADNIELIRQDAIRINVASYIFEYIALALPMKKLHPRFRTNEEEINEKEESVLIYQTSIEPDISASDEENTTWAALLKLKGKE
ncbi:MAG: DUF177 domain-containing protein [Spirosomataceae bacterium]